MAITNKNLVKKGSRLLPDLLEDAVNIKADISFKKKIDGFNYIIPQASCPNGCSLQPEVVYNNDGEREIVFVCKRPNGSLC